MGRAFASSMIAKKSGCTVGSPPEICTTSGGFRCSPLRRAFFRSARAGDAPGVPAASRVANGAAQIAGVGNFDKRQTGVLLVIGAPAAIVGAAPFYRRVVDYRHFRPLDENFAAAPVVIDIVGDQHSLGAVFRASLQQKYLFILEDDLPSSCESKPSRSSEPRRKTCRGERARPPAYLRLGLLMSLMNAQTTPPRKQSRKSKTKSYTRCSAARFRR